MADAGPRFVALTSFGKVRLMRREPALFAREGHRRAPKMSQASNVNTYTDNTHPEIVSNLPASYATRWSASRKAAVVRAVHSGQLSLGTALERYRLSGNEFRSWEEHLAIEGVRGLKARELYLHRQPQDG
jgi:hypothetical protein